MRTIHIIGLFLLLCALSGAPFSTASAEADGSGNGSTSPIEGITQPADAAVADENSKPVENDLASNTTTLSIPSETSAAPKRLESHNRVIEEIVVTAQKREENIQDVPISIQAFSGDAIAARGIADTQGLGQVVPGLQFTNAVGFTLIFLRGVGSDNFIPSADPSIATYIDGIYIASGHAVTESLGNIERVEVLKGPQGTLFGRNATGGAISIVTEEPGNTAKGSVEGELGNFNDRTGKFYISGPITDWLSAGLSGQIAYDDGYYTDINYKLQRDLGRAIRFKVNIHPTDDLSFSFTAFHSDQRGPGTLIGKNTSPSALGRALLIEPQVDNHAAQSDYPAAGIASQDIQYGNVSWKLPWLDIKALGSNQYIHTSKGAVDFDGSPQPIASFDDENGFSKLLTGELQFISNQNTPFSDKLKWIAGLYYLRSKAGLDPAYLRAAPSAFTALDNELGGFGLPIPQGIQSLSDTLLANSNTPLGVGGLSLAFRGLLATRSYSAYTQGTYFIADWVDVTLGGRFQYEKRYLTKSTTELSNLDGGTGTTTLITWPLDDGHIVTNFSPKAILSFHPLDKALIYASYSVGFKSGTYNIVNIYTPPNYIVPEEVETYELGAKLEFLNGLLRVNGALFDNQITNLQSGFVSLLAGGAIRFQTAGSARTRGAEFDGTWVPLPTLDEGLALTANAAYVDAVYTDFQNGSGFQPGTRLYSGNLDFTGNRLVRTPKVSGGIGIAQTIERTSGTYELAVDEYYNSGFFFDAFNTVKQATYAVLGAHGSYLYAPWNLRVTAYGKNLLDRQYHLQVLQTDFGVIDTLASPLEFGFRLGWQF